MAARALTTSWVLVALLLAGCGGGQPVREPQTLSVQIEGRSFDLELALTDKQRHQGLSDRAEIAADGGMLFVFPRSQRRTFVMRRCLVPIDIMFLDSEGRVVQMHEMQVEAYDLSDEQLTPYHSVWPARYAIELRGGTLRELGLLPVEPGKLVKVKLPHERLKRLLR